MAEAGPAFEPGAYIVRYGGRVMLRAVACVLGGLAIIVGRRVRDAARRGGAAREGWRLDGVALLRQCGQ